MSLFPSDYIIRYDNPHTNPQVGKSDCCNAQVKCVPGFFADPSFNFCTACNTECQIVWKPIFEKVGKGCYRKIIYEINMSDKFEKI
jgi:hypothetical protein